MDTQNQLTGRDHGGGLDAAVAKYGGRREDWLDLSTGINPNPYVFSDVPKAAWTDLPDQAAYEKAMSAARRFWKIPDDAAGLLAPGLSSVIAQLPFVMQGQNYFIEEPTYNEYRAAFDRTDWTMPAAANQADLRIVVSPNNPTGKWFGLGNLSDETSLVVDESFADIAPENSNANLARRSNTLLLKGLGKFWGLAGLRFGAAFGDALLIARLQDRFGPWAVSGPALHVAAEALKDVEWANQTRENLSQMAGSLDQIFDPLMHGAARGTTLFRLYKVKDATVLHHYLCRSQILTRVFPYDKTLIRVGLPADDTGLSRLRAAIKGVM